jgi:amidase
MAHGDECCGWSASAMAEAVAAGRVSSVELTEAHLRRIEARNGAVGVVVTLDADRALAEASALDAERSSGRRRGPFHGVPMTVKDSFLTAGMRTTSGAPDYATFVPDRDAEVVARMRAAGAVVVGKTNLPIFAGDVQSFNELFGTSSNPWNPSRSVGGSSGGSAGALACGFTPLEIGSDIAGSIRNPAGMCGVVGHKPSFGVVSGRGQIPGPPGTLTEADLAVVGPMARTVADAAAMLEVLAGPNDWLAPAWRLHLPPARAHDAAGLRVAIWADDPACPVDRHVRAAVDRVGAALEVAGARVDAAARPEGVSFERSVDTFWRLLGGALAGSWTPVEIEHHAAQVAAGERVEGDLGVVHSEQRHRAWLSANERRLQLRSRWRRFFEDWDVVIAPISPTVAIPHDHSGPLTSRTLTINERVRPYTDQMAWMGLFGVAYLPATAVPVAIHPDGLPIGVQVVGPFLEDRTTLAAAAVVESLTGGFRWPPGWEPGDETGAAE